MKALIFVPILAMLLITTAAASANCNNNDLPLCSEVEDESKTKCFDDEDRPERTEQQKEESERQGIGCQPEDDYCDYDQHCELTSVDCIDDRGFDEDDYNG
jgi:hypothetical protein